MSNVTVIDWSRQPRAVDKSVILICYIIIGVLSIPLGLMRIFSIICSKKKITPTTIFIVQLMCSCILLNTVGSIYCILIYNNGSFPSEQYGCNIQAFFILSSTILQFQSILMIAWSNWMSVAHRQKQINVRCAVMISIIQCIVSIATTAALGSISIVWLMPIGVYCFYDMRSLAALWYGLILLITLLGTIYYYCRIVSVARQASKYRLSDISSTKTAMRSFLFVFAYAAGWFPSIIIAVYATVTYTEISETMDVFLTLCSALHSIWQPLVHIIFDGDIPIILIYWCECWTKIFPNYTRTIEDGRVTVVRVNTNIHSPSIVTTPISQDVKRMSRPGIQFVYYDTKRMSTDLSPPSPQTPDIIRPPVAGGWIPISRIQVVT